MSIQEKIYKLYTENREISQFILNFFRLDEGIRCRVFQEKYPIRKAPLRYRDWDHDNLIPITPTNFLQEIRTNKGELHFYESIYDDEVKNPNITLEELPNHVIGTQIVIDIDILDDYKYIDIANKTTEEIPKNFFSHQAFKSANILKTMIEEGLDELGFEYNCMFSGNGIYIIIEIMYLGVRELEEFIDRMYKLMLLYDDTAHSAKLDFHIDLLKWRSWDKYKKIPFTYHERWNRMSIPLPKGDLDFEYIKTYSDLDFIFRYPYIINTIIRTARWEKLW